MSYYGYAKRQAATGYAKRQTATGQQAVASRAAKDAYSNTYSKMSPDTELLIDQMLNPEDCNEVTRWPNTYGLSSVYKCKTVLNARFDVDGRSCVVVAPTIKDSIFATWGEESTVPLVNYGALGNPFSFQQVTLDSINEQVLFNAPIIFGNGQALLPQPASSAKSLLYPIGFTSANASLAYPSLTVLFPNAIVMQAMVKVRLFDVDKTVLVTFNMGIGPLDPTFPGQIGANIDFGPGAVTLSDIAYMDVQFTATSIPYKGPVYLFLSRTGSSTTDVDVILPNHAQHVGVYDIKDASQLEQSASQAFVLSQSLLLTAEMSDINNGGTLAIARVPGNNPIGIDGVNAPSSINSNNWYGWLSSLSNNNHDGPVKDGGYAFYLPEDETGFFYRSIDNYFSKELPYLAAEFTTVVALAESSVVRIKICSLVQFTTTASIYDQRPSCHVSDLELVHHILSLVPAAYTNAGHKEALKKVLNKIGGKIKVMLRDPNTYVRAGQLMAKLAPAVLAAL